MSVKKQCLENSYHRPDLREAAYQMISSNVELNQRAHEFVDYPLLSKI